MPFPEVIFPVVNFKKIALSLSAKALKSWMNVPVTCRRQNLAGRSITPMEGGWVERCTNPSAVEIEMRAKRPR
jgi:hypothetical protein